MLRMFLAVLVAASSARGFEIVGPDHVPAGDGFVRLSAVISPGHTIRWAPLQPRDLEYVILTHTPTEEETDLHAGLAPGSTIQTMMFCRCTVGEIEVLAIDVAGEAPPHSITPATHKLTIGDPQPTPDPAPPEPTPEPNPPPAEKLLVIILEETRDDRHEWGNVWVELRQLDLAGKLAPHEIIIEDDDTTNPSIVPYVGLWPDRPAIVIDDDWNPHKVFHAGDCPASVADILALMSRYADVQAVTEPDFESQPPTQPAPAAAPSPRSDTRSPSGAQARFEPIWVGSGNTRKLMVRDTETGKRHAVNSDRSFIVDGQRYEVQQK